MDSREVVGAFISLAIVLIIGIPAVIFCFKMVGVTSKIQKEIKKQKQSDKAQGITRHESLLHISGLNVAEKGRCSIKLSPNSMVIVSNGTEMSLKLDRIQNIDFRMDVDEKQYLKSSLVGGVVGAAAFGVSGAVIGSRPKTKVKREVTGYAFITYEDARGSRRTFILSDAAPGIMACSGLIDALRPKIKTKLNKVEL